MARICIFGAGKFDPGSDSGKRLLAHELTHTIQQTGGVNAKQIQRDGETSPSSPTNASLEASETPVFEIGITAPAPSSAPNLDEIEHLPQYEQEAVAIWDGWLDSTIRTKNVVQVDSSFPSPTDQESDSPKPQPRFHFSSEEQALAALKSQQIPGVVFVENGRYVAYHLDDGSWLSSFTWDNVRHSRGKPWTEIQFTSHALEHRYRSEAHGIQEIKGSSKQESDITQRS